MISSLELACPDDAEANMVLSERYNELSLAMLKLEFSNEFNMGNNSYLLQ